ncbi:MAG: hypothetical protein ACRDHY_01415 [Anaerolineales bacterium]
MTSAWRDQRDQGALVAMKARRPGPKGDPVRAENARLREQVTHLEERLATAEELIDAQGKVPALLQRHSHKSAGPK